MGTTAQLGRYLIAACLAGFVWIARAAEPAAELLANGSLDQGDGAVPSAWDFQRDVGQGAGRWRSDGGTANSGCLEVTVTKAGQCDFRPAEGAVPLEPGNAYLLTAAIKASTVAAGSHSVELQWFGDTGFISRDIAAAAVKDRWVSVAVGPVTPPDGASSVYVLLRCYATGTYAFDDVRLEASPGVAAGRNLLHNSGFEADADGDGVPDNWEPAPPIAGGDTPAWERSVRHSGAHSVRSQRPEGVAANHGLWSQSGVAVTPALRYELSAATRADAFGRGFRLAIEWLQGGKVVAVDELTDQTTEGWQRKALKALAPPTAEQARVTLQAQGTGTVWFDSVALSEDRPAARLDLWLEAPNARGLIRDGIDAKVLKVCFALESTEPAVGLRLTLVDAGGKELAESRPLASQGTWEPGITTLGRGAYRVVAEALSAEGRALLSESAPLDIVAGDAAGVFFRADHIAVVGGKPWFPIGVCSMPVLDPVAEKLAAAGFNLVVTGDFTSGAPEKVREILERARALGLCLIEWNNGWAYDDISVAEREERYRQSAAKVAGHPAFLGWMCDEALWNGVPLARVRHSAMAARAAAPTCVFWENQAPRNRVEDLARYVRWADVTGMDIYPVEGADHSDLPNKTLSVVGDEVDKQHRTTLPAPLAADPAAPGRKPVWAILQGFGWNAWEKDKGRHKRAPTWDETRFMAYDAILHGAVGIVYWGASYEAQEAPIWDALRRVARELADLTPVLVSSERVPVRVDGAPGVIAQGRRVAGKLWVIAANERGEAATARLQAREAKGSFERVAESADLTAADGVITDSFGPFGVHLYRER